MFQLVVVVLESRLGVVGRVDVDALHLPAIVGQQGFQGEQVVTLDQQVFRIPVAVGGLKLQQVIGHGSGNLRCLCLVDPVEEGHGLPK
jgi:hypothetical protein